jgi:hypothetical protein
LQLCFWEDGVEDTPCHRMDREPDGVIDLIDAAALALSLTGPR